MKHLKKNSEKVAQLGATSEQLNDAITTAAEVAKQQGMKPTDKMTRAELQAVIREKEEAFNAVSKQLETAREARRNAERDLKKTFEKDIEKVKKSERTTQIALELKRGSLKQEVADHTNTKHLLEKALKERNTAQEEQKTLEEVITTLRAEQATATKALCDKDNKIKGLTDANALCKANNATTIAQIERLMNRTLWERIINRKTL